MRPLARVDLTRFLAALARRLPCPATVVLTGGAEARRQVEHFFRTHGLTIWGPRFDPETAIAAFHRAAGISAGTD